MTHQHDTNDWDAFVDSLFDDQTPIPTKPAVARQKFSCQQCGGTGLWAGGRTNRHGNNKCLACKGKGYFLTDEATRRKARTAKVATKRNKLQEFKDDYPAVWQELVNNDLAGRPSSFLASLHDQVIAKGYLSERQTGAVLSNIAKREEREAARVAAEAKVVEAAPQYARLADTFLSAAESLKWPKLRLVTTEGQKVVLSRCGGNSRTPGHINVTDGGPYGANTYFGRIDPAGHGFLRNGTREDVLAVLAAYNADPAAEGKVQGMRTGACMCCGRELTNHASIDLGIGPICAAKWGLM